MLLSSFLVSTSFVVGELVTHQIDPAVITFIRFSVGGLILGAIVVARGEFKYSHSLFLRAAAMSSCLVSFFWLMFWALRYTTALNTSVIFAITPLFSAVYSLFILREIFNGRRFVALTYGALGAVWVIFQGDLSLVSSMNWNRGDLIFLLGCAAMGFYAPLIKLLHRGESMLLLTFWVLVTGSIILLPLSLFKLVQLDFLAISVLSWFGILYLATFTTVITFYLVQASIPHLGPIKVTSYSYLYPVLVLLLNLFCGRGLPDIATWPGIIIVVSAMFFIKDDSDDPKSLSDSSQQEQV